MTVGIKLGNITDEIGAASFLYSFFSTIAAKLEPEGWGSRFPVLQRNLYSGELSSGDAGAALDELALVRTELARFPPKAVVWDYQDRSKTPPWGDDIADTITDLSNYFVTSTGRDLIGGFEEVFEALKESPGIAKLVQYQADAIEFVRPD